MPKFSQGSNSNKIPPYPSSSRAEWEVMASALGGALSSSPSAAVGLNLHHNRSIALLPKPRQFSLPPTAALLSTPPRTHHPRASRKWTLPALSESLEPEAAPVLEPEPEPVEVQIAASEGSESAKGEDVFAVVMIGSHQYIVFPGRFITTQRLKGANANDKIILNKVLLVGTRTKAYIGQPVVTNAAVHAVVEEQGLNRKVIVYKYKKKKNYRRNIGHRQPNTRIRITGITGYKDFPADTLESVPA